MRALCLTLTLGLALPLAGCASSENKPARSDEPLERDRGKLPPGVRPVIVVRHAQAFKNLKPRPKLSPEKLDSLTDQGKAEARDLAKGIAWSHVTCPIVAVLSSPKGRTRETAAIITEALELPVTVTPALAPLDGGPTKPDFGERIAKWKAGEDWRPEGGETLEDGVKRALAAIAKQPHGCVVIVTHGDIAAGVIGEAKGTAMAERWAKHEIAGGTLQHVQLKSAGE